MELAIYSIWQVDIRNLVKNKLYISRDWHIQPSEIDVLPFYEYEFYLEEITTANKEQEKQQKEQEKGYKMPNMSNYNNMLNGSGFKMPHINMPKI